MAAQATSPEAAILDLIEALLDAMEAHDGAIRSVEIHGVMTGPERCTIWGQACLDAPITCRPLHAIAVEIDHSTRPTAITVSLRAGS